ncbi:MAG: hypothetical protein HYW65_04185 [Candidatus Liptonbacteria bacterium]|nr:hypothetical protein [Candidatus Liptonbacteria bacterium]
MRTPQSKPMKIKKTTRSVDPLSKLVDLQITTSELPQLSPLEKAQLDHALAIEQLYYSSKVEGSNLTKEMIDKAIHGKKFSAA